MRSSEGQLHHVRRGRGEPLLLVHPLGGELVVWEPVMDRLARERDTIAVDLPGFGASPASPADPTPQALALALAGFLDGLGISRAHLAGNSLGAWVALELAKAGRALSVAALCPAGLWARPLAPRGGPDVRRLGRAALPMVRPLVHSARGRRLLLRGSMAHPERVPAEAALRLVRAYVTAPAFDAANVAMRAGTFSGADQITAPVTIAWGERDRTVTRRPAPDPDWRTVLLRDCGHVPTWDDPRQVAQVLLMASA
jgi:pimeloyl-ACP methyl ester carboxylesterase